MAPPIALPLWFKHVVPASSLSHFRFYQSLDEALFSFIFLVFLHHNVKAMARKSVANHLVCLQVLTKSFSMHVSFNTHLACLPVSTKPFSLLASFNKVILLVCLFQQSHLICMPVSTTLFCLQPVLTKSFCFHAFHASFKKLI